MKTKSVPMQHHIQNLIRQILSRVAVSSDRMPTIQGRMVLAERTSVARTVATIGLMMSERWYLPDLLWIHDVDFVCSDARIEHGVAHDTV